MFEKTFVIIFIFIQLKLSVRADERIRKVDGIVLALFDKKFIPRSGSCEKCMCEFFRDQIRIGFNCFKNNGTCHIFTKCHRQKAHQMINDNSSSFYFLPSFHNRTIYDSNPPIEYRWTFDSTYNDINNTFNVTGYKNVSFSSNTINGYGFSLNLERNLSQALSMTTPHVPLFDRSWTFELWLYLHDYFNATHDSPIIGQCAEKRLDTCLHLNVRKQRLYFGFHHNDLSGKKTVNKTVWYHVAFVFDCSNLKRFLFIDGRLENNDSTCSCYEGETGSLNFGTTDISKWAQYIDALIDEIAYVNRAKTPEEILRDATLTC